ncbi:hypothetical protein PL263_10705 [Methylomonas sp. EFPC3]|nr:hypothetical protein [Methylomonas sp. EFPC3]WFP48583.1 hypothetical protein PL263_10705 [Methylomonas sp. EFPC3]
MKQFPGLKSETWLSGINNRTVDGNLSVKLFDGEITREANIGMNSPYYPT